MLGYPVSDWLQRRTSSLTRSTRTTTTRVLAEVERTHDTGEDFRCEYRLIAADGRTVWVLDETVAVRDEEYRPLFLQGFLVDVTDRRASDEALRQSEELHRLVARGLARPDRAARSRRDGATTRHPPSQSLLG